MHYGHACPRLCKQPAASGALQDVLVSPAVQRLVNQTIWHVVRHAERCACTTHPRSVTPQHPALGQLCQHRAALRAFNACKCECVDHKKGGHALSMVGNHDHAFDRVHHPAAPGVQALRLQASSSTQTCNMQRKAGRQHPVCWDHQCRAAWATSSSSSRCWWLASSCTVAGHVDVLPAVGAGHCSTATAVTSSMALIGALCCCRWGVA